MPRLKIKQLETRTATAGLFMGGGPERRKLQPGEIVDIPEEFEAGMYNGMGLFDAMWATGKVEMTPDAATRPLDYNDPREAKLNSPTFNPRGPDEEIEVDRARAAVAARMDESSEANSPATDSQPEPVVESSPAVKDTPPVTNRRAQRRAAMKGGAASGSEVPA
jgi:hypothetical protein